MKEITRLQQLAGILTEIKVNDPNPKRGVEGYKHFLKEWFGIMEDINQDLKIIYQEEKEGIGPQLANKIFTLHQKLYKKYNINYNEYNKEWIDEHILDKGHPKINSSGSFFTALNDEEQIIGEEFSEIFGIDEDELYEIYKLEKQNW